MKGKLFFFISILLICNYSYADASSPLKSDSYVYIISPAHGEKVSNPINVKFGLQGMGIAPAGTDIKGTGHHHLFIDVKDFPDFTKPIPADENHIHFGKGQTETSIELAPGKHTLQLIFADFAHIPHEPAMISESITIYVTE